MALDALTILSIAGLVLGVVLSSVVAFIIVFLHGEEYHLPAMFMGGCYIITVNFMVGLHWGFEPENYPRTFCKVSSLLYNLGGYCLTSCGVTLTITTWNAVNQARKGKYGSICRPWHIPPWLRWFFYSYPLIGLAIFATLTLHFDAAGPEGRWICDIARPGYQWIRLFGYGGIDVLVTIPAFIASVMSMRMLWAIHTQPGVIAAMQNHYDTTVQSPAAPTAQSLPSVTACDHAPYSVDPNNDSSLRISLGSPQSGHVQLPPRVAFETPSGLERGPASYEEHSWGSAEGGLSPVGKSRYGDNGFDDDASIIEPEAVLASGQAIYPYNAYADRRLDTFGYQPASKPLPTSLWGDHLGRNMPDEKPSRPHPLLSDPMGLNDATRLVESQTTSWRESRTITEKAGTKQQALPPRPKSRSKQKRRPGKLIYALYRIMFLDFVFTGIEALAAVTSLKAVVSGQTPTGYSTAFVAVVLASWAPVALFGTTPMVLDRIFPRSWRASIARRVRGDS